MKESAVWNKQTHRGSGAPTGIYAAAKANHRDLYSQPRSSRGRSGGFESLLLISHHFHAHSHAHPYATSEYCTKYKKLKEKTKGKGGKQIKKSLIRKEDDFNQVCNKSNTTCRRPHPQAPSPKLYFSLSLSHLPHIIYPLVPGPIQTTAPTLSKRVCKQQAKVFGGGESM